MFQKSLTWKKKLSIGLASSYQKKNNCEIVLNMNVSWINTYKKEVFRFNIVLKKSLLMLLCIYISIFTFFSVFVRDNTYNKFKRRVVGTQAGWS